MFLWPARRLINPLSAEIKASRVEVNGVNLHYERTGWGDNAVLLLPGALDIVISALLKSRIWSCDQNLLLTALQLIKQKGEGPENFIFLYLSNHNGNGQTHFGPQLAYLNKELFTIIAWDPRGYGKSMPPIRDFPSDFFERDAKDAIDLMQALKFEKFSLVGWSNGGITALTAAGTYPSLIHKLVVVGANAFVTADDKKRYIDMLDVSNWSERMRNPMEDLYGMEYLQKTFKAWVEAMSQFTSRPEGNICRHLLPFIKCPTLIVHGLNDGIVPPCHSKFIHEKIKGSRLHLIPGGNHNVQLQYIEEFNKLVEDFLR